MAEPVTIDSTSLRTATLRWHHALTGAAVIRPTDEEAAPAERRKPDRGAWAEIRNCTTVSEALMTESFARYLREVFPVTEHRKDVIAQNPPLLAALARTAILVAQADQADLSQRLAAQMAAPKAQGSTRPCVPRTVATSFFKAESPDEALVHGRSILGMVGGALNICDLAATMVYWPKGRERLSIAYFDAVLNLETPRSESDTKS